MSIEWKVSECEAVTPSATYDVYTSSGECVVAKVRLSADESNWVSLCDQDADDEDLHWPDMEAAKAACARHAAELSPGAVLAWKVREYTALAAGMVLEITVYRTDVAVCYRCHDEMGISRLHDVNADGHECDWPTVDAAKDACERLIERLLEKRAAREAGFAARSLSRAG